MDRDKYFIEIESATICEDGQTVPGNVCLQKRVGDRSVVVIADGEGSGVRANTYAGVVAAMAVNYTIMNETPQHAAGSIIRTFGHSAEDNPGKTEFIITDIRRNGQVRIAEYETPGFLLLRGGEILQPNTQKTTVENYTITTSEFTVQPEDRIVLLTDGIVTSGKMTKRLSAEWGRNGVATLCTETIRADETVSAHALCEKIMQRAEINDLFAPKNDMSCSVIYFRQPRKIMVCSGPPFNEHKDEMLADMIESYDGTKVVCGGTTAQIIARELGRDVNVILRYDPSGLPPTSSMEGMDMVTEGVMTLSKVKKLLDRSADSFIHGKGTDKELARLLLEHDIVEFVVGTRINPLHQDPDLPVELEVRRNLIRELAAVLTNKYMKEVRIQFI